MRQASVPVSNEIEFRAPRVLAQELAAFVEQKIIFLELEMGPRLTEEEIGRRYGVSRSPVREAMRILENDGLIVRLPRRGAWISPITLADVNEVYACRLPLEGLAAELAAARSSRVSVTPLERAFEALERSSGDVRAYFESNVAFTRTIHDMAGNRTLRRLIGTISKQSLRYRYLAYSKLPHLIDASIKGNRRVLKAVLKGDSGAARAITEQLIRNSWNQVVDYLKGQGSGDLSAADGKNCPPTIN
jgi:DNA-binding GntR family transcriptional regulator